MTQPLKTDRLLLEPLTVEHAAEMFTGLSDPALYKFIGGDPPESLEILQRSYQALVQRASSDDPEIWRDWIIRESLTGSCLGFVRATIEEATAEIEYLLFRTSWERRFTTEAVHEVIQELWRDGVVAIVADVHEHNERSCRLLRGLQFVEIERDGHDLRFRLVRPTEMPGKT